MWVAKIGRVLSLQVSGKRWNQGQTCKNRTRSITSHLTEEAWSVKDLYNYDFWRIFLRDIAGSPEQARWHHLARSGSQSQLRIGLILPAQPRILHRDAFKGEMYLE